MADLGMPDLWQGECAAPAKLARADGAAGTIAAPVIRSAVTFADLWPPLLLVIPKRSLALVGLTVAIIVNEILGLLSGVRRIGPAQLTALVKSR